MVNVKTWVNRNAERGHRENQINGKPIRTRLKYQLRPVKISGVEIFIDGLMPMFVWQFIAIC